MRKFLYLLSLVLLISLAMISCEKAKTTETSENNNVVNETIATNKNEVKTEDEQLVDNTSEETVETSTKNIEYITVTPEEVKIPILMYHSISDADPNNSLLVPTAMFEKQMAWLEQNDFTAMSMDEVLEAMETGVVPKRPVVITFDDGYSDNYTSAFPSLKNHGLKATFFVITDGVDDGYYMSSDMLKEMQAAGMSIENHTANHLELNSLSRDAAYDSIKRGQDYLRDVIGSDGNYLCYPVGRYNDETIEIQKELGIKAATTTNGGIATLSNGVHELNRVRIAPMSIENFAEIFSDYIY